MDRTKLLSILVFLFGVIPGSYAQFTLDEIGLNIGAGYSHLPSEMSNGNGWAGHLSGFYSHYFCGKRHGFHVLAGAKYASHSVTGVVVPGNVGIPSLQSNLSFGSVELGFLGKIRKNEYHRPKETALMIGPRFSLPLFGSYSEGGVGGSLSEIAPKLQPFSVGAQLSVQVRRTFDKKSFFFHPGIEYFFMPVITGTAQGDYRNLYLFLQFGFNFWDARG